MANSSIKIRGKAAIGAALVVLGATTMLGWLLRVPAMVEIVHGLVPMTFNAGLGFCLAGTCLLVRGPYGKPVRAVLGAFMLGLYGLTLLEHLFDTSFGIDLARLHLWHDYGNTRHGRMAPNTAFGFMLVGAINLRLARIGSRAAAFTVVLLTFCLLTVGLTGLVGYLLAPDLLFGWARSARMALHTAAGMIAASIGIWIGWSGSSWFTGPRFFTEAAKVRFLGTAILIMVTTTVGLAGFVLMQQSLKSAIEGRLAAVAQARGPWLVATTREIAQHARSEMRLVDADAAAAALLAGGSAQRFDAAARRLLEHGYRYAAVEEAGGRVVRELGAAPGDAGRAPPFVARLDSDGTELVWNGMPMLRIRMSVMQDGRLLGFVRLDRSLRAFERSLFNMAGLGDAALAACVLHGRELVCLPRPGDAGVARIDLDHRGGARLLPMEYAVAGHTGIVHTLDQHERSVVAAYAPIHPGFGFVAEQDTTDAYVAIRHALQLGIPVILAIAVLGAAALYSQTDPLVTRMHASERQAEQSAAETRSLMQAVGDGIMTIDRRNQIRSVNPAACRIFGYEEQELLGQSVSVLIPPELRAAHAQGVTRAAAGVSRGVVGGAAVTVQGVRKDGSRFPLELTVTGVMVGAERQFVGVMRDITERRALEEKLERMAQYDALTGLANRRLFMERLRLALQRGARHGYAVAVMFIDLDGFKQVNDTLGHHAGDELLVEAARRMCAAVRRTDTVARLGGDEFTVILEDARPPADHARAVAEKILAEMRRPFGLADGPATIGASIGLLVHEDGPRVDVDEILREADARMYAAKQAGKNRVVAV